MPELCDQLHTGKITAAIFLRQGVPAGRDGDNRLCHGRHLTGETFMQPAHAATPKAGGTLRVSMRVQEMTDPATFDWVEKSNVARFLVEHLTRTKADNTTVPYLAEKWKLLTI